MGKYFYGGKNRGNLFLVLFLAGFILGTAMIYVGQERLVSQSDFLDVYYISRLRYLEIDRGALLLYSLKKRMEIFILLSLLGLVGAGAVGVCAGLIWSGLCAGTVLSVLSIRYGIRGLLLFAGGIFPQALLLVPAFWCLFQWCVRPGKGMEIPGGGRRGTKDGVSRLLTLALIGAVVVAGCLLESYVNPAVLKKVLRIF